MSFRKAYLFTDLICSRTRNRLFLYLTSNFRLKLLYCTVFGNYSLILVWNWTSLPTISKTLLSLLNSLGSLSKISERSTKAIWTDAIADQHEMLTCSMWSIIFHTRIRSSMESQMTYFRSMTLLKSSVRGFLLSSLDLFTRPRFMLYTYFVRMLWHSSRQKWRRYSWFSLWPII